MQRVPRGFTIIEALIFLAVSGFLIGLSFVFLSRQESQTRFSQSARDLQSKVNDWINDVSTGFPTGQVASPNDYASGNLSGKVYCSVNGGFQVMIDKANTSDASKSQSDCIFLGKALQFTQKDESDSQSHFVYAYSVFGSRLDKNGDLVSTLADAVPVAAGAQGSGQANLTEEYRITGDTQVIKITSNALNSGAGSDHLIGFYLNLNTQQNTSSNGAEDLRTYGYPLSFTSENSKDVQDCINMQSKCVPTGQDNPDGLQNVQICLSSDSAGQTALLTINSNDGLGASVDLKFTACS